MVILEGWERVFPPPFLLAGRGVFSFQANPKGGRMALRMRVHDREPIGMALRRFKKLLERSGVQKELRAHQHYEKPSEQRRRSELRKVKVARKGRGVD